MTETPTGTARVEIPEEARHLVEGRTFAHVATLMADGSPQVSPVWIDHEDGLILFNTAEGRVKVRNLRRDPRVALSVTNPEEPYEALTVRGRVVEITAEGAGEHADKLAKRYHDWDSYPSQPGETRLIVRIQPEHIHHKQP